MTELLNSPVKVELFPERADQADSADQANGRMVTDARGRPVISTSSLPSNRKTQFFGVEAPGQVFVFIIDQSGSMEAGDRMSRAKRELRATIRALEFPQRFQVIAFNDFTRPCQSLPATATTREKDKFEHWLRTLAPEGGTEPRRALSDALAIRPDAVFLLTDGELPPGTARETAQLNARAAQANGGDLVPIHCIDLSVGPPAADLMRIARESGGTFVAPLRVRLPLRPSAPLQAWAAPGVAAPVSGLGGSGLRLPHTLPPITPHPTPHTPHDFRVRLPLRPSAPLQAWFR